MSAGIRDLVANLRVNSAGMKTGLSEGMSSIRSAVKGFAALALPIAGAFGMEHSIEQAREQIGAQKRLQAVLDATGHAAGFSDKQLFEMAEGLQRTTNFSHEATEGAMAMMATFKNVQGDTFGQAIKSAQDLATIFQMDLPSAARLVGKALQDPLRGMNTLRRAGVSLSQEQQAQVKQMMASGDIAGAQQVILAGMKGSFGGAAQSMASPLAQLKNLINDISADIGMTMLPTLKVIASTFSEWLGPADDAKEKCREIGAEIAAVVSGAFSLANALGGPVVTAIGQTKALFEGVFITGTVGASALGDVWNLVADNMSLGVMKLIPSSEGAFKTIGIYGAATWEFLATAFGITWDNIKSMFFSMVDIAKAAGAAIGAAFSAALNLENPIKAAGDALAEGMKNVTKNLGQGMTNPVEMWQKSMAAFSTTFANASQGINEQGGIKNAIQAGRDQLQARVKDAMDKVEKGPEKPETPGQKFTPGSLGGVAATGKQSRGDLKVAGLTAESKDLQQQIVSAMRGDVAFDVAERTAVATEKIAQNTDPSNQDDDDDPVANVSGSMMD